MPEWKLVQLPSFQADVAKYQPDQEKLNKWLGDLSKSPTTLKKAHALRGALKPFWSAHAHFDVLYVVTYLLCSGNESSCFLHQGIERFNYINSAEVMHTCDKKQKMIYAARMTTQHDYSQL
jgi:mRNA-degrading endonuclease YafQ of YafQ-DinJ toxin-antitoxin module